MAYITNQDLIDQVGNDTAVQLTSESGAVVDQDKVTTAVSAAEGEANGYLARRYAVPVDLTEHADLAGTLKGFTLDIGVFRLHSLRRPVPDDIRRAREEAVKWLQGVSKGEIVLPAAVTPASTTSNDPASTWGSSPAAASRENMGVGPAE